MSIYVQEFTLKAETIQNISFTNLILCKKYTYVANYNFNETHDKLLNIIQKKTNMFFTCLTN